MARVGHVLQNIASDITDDYLHSNSRRCPLLRKLAVKKVYDLLCLLSSAAFCNTTLKEDNNTSASHDAKKFTFRTNIPTQLFLLSTKTISPFTYNVLHNLNLY